MNHKQEAGMAGKFPVVFFSVALMGLLLIGCEPDKNTLGIDIFPPQDGIVVHTDTITEFETMLVRSRPRATSVNLRNVTDTRTFLLGSMVDTITGLSKAEIVTEVNLFRFGNFGEDPFIDSLSLWFYVSEVIGDTAQEMHIKVYEFLDSLSMDSVYYSDYDVTGKYNPEPLVDEVFTPRAGEFVRFDIDNQELFNRIFDATIPTDTVFATYNSKFQRIFNGLYITTEAVGDGGTFAKLQLANDYSGMRFRYYHDSISVAARDTIPLSTYYMGFNENLAQKVNIFHHDFTGTALENLIDNPDARPRVAYAQGMAGVNVKISVPNLEEYVGTGQVALNAARMIFYVVPDSSGISAEDYPPQLMMDSQLSDGTPVQLYDQVTNTNPFNFGKLTQSNENSAFLDPLYYYSFDVGRHFQSVILGEIENNDLFIFVNNPVTTTNIIKFWSNYSGLEGGLKLELIYSKFD